MPRHRPIQIRFIRRLPSGIAENDPTRDDILTVANLSDGRYRTVYTEKSDPETVFVDLTLCNNHQLLAYLYRVFWLTSLDGDPFQSVQFFIPGYPSFLLLVSTLKQHIPNILDVIASTYLNWPTIGYDRQEPARVSTHLLFAGVGSPEQPSNGGTDGDGTDGV